MPGDDATMSPAEAAADNPAANSAPAAAAAAAAAAGAGPAAAATAPAAASTPGSASKVLAPSDAMHRVRELIVKGFLDVGQVLHFTYREASFQGTVGEQGDILYMSDDSKSQESFRAPSAFANAMAKRHNSANRVRVRGRINLNGWDWCSTDTGETLQQLRNMMVTGEPAPVKRKRSASPDGHEGVRKIPRFDSAADPNINVCDDGHHDNDDKDDHDNPDDENGDPLPLDDEDHDDAELEEGERPEDGDDESAVPRSKRGSASSGDAGGNLDEDASIALALAAADDKNRRRTTRLASGSIKQIDYKQPHPQDQAALAKAKSLEEQEDDNDDQNANASTAASVEPNDASTQEGRRTRANKRRVGRRAHRYRRAGREEGSEPGQRGQFEDSPEDMEDDGDEPEGTQDQMEDSLSPAAEVIKQETKDSPADEESNKRDQSSGTGREDGPAADAASNEGRRTPNEEWTIEEQITLLEAIRKRKPTPEDIERFPSAASVCKDLLQFIPGISRKEPQIKEFLAFVENRMKETNMCHSGGNFYEFIGFLASEIACAKERPAESEESDGAQKPASPTGKANDQEKGKKKQRKELEETRQKLDLVMQARRELELEKNVLDVQVRDVKRSLEQQLRLRAAAEEELEDFKNRELEARRRLDRAKLKLSALKGESVVEVVESTSLQARDPDDSNGMEVEHSADATETGDPSELKRLKNELARQQAMISMMEYETADFQRSLQAERKRSLLLLEAKRRLEYESYIMNAGVTKRSGDSAARKSKTPAGGTSSKAVRKPSTTSLPGPTTKRGPTSGGIYKSSKGTAKRKGQPVKSPS